MIREATIDDFPEILRMARLFAEQAGLEVDDDSILETAESLISSDSGVIFIGKGAMAGALAYPMYMKRDKIAAQEMFWWVDPEKRSNGSGMGLLKSLEGWANEVGASRMTMIGLDSSPAHLDKFYRQSGYRPLEISYWKEL